MPAKTHGCPGETGAVAAHELTIGDRFRLGRIMAWSDSAMQDVRYAVRGWRKAPGFAVAAIVTLAAGIGANTAIFTVVSGVLLRPLPFPQPERLVRIYEKQPRDRSGVGFDGPVVAADMEQWRTHSRLFESMATYTTSGTNLQGAGDPEQVTTIAGERGLFEVLGAAAAIGRTFRPGDPPSVAVASHEFWKTHLGEDRSAIGQNITLDGKTFTVIGVMPERFQFPYSPSPVHLWIPFDLPAQLRAWPNSRVDAVVGRLKPGVELDAATRELSAMEGPANARREVRLKRLRDVVSGPARNSLIVLLGAVGMVLLVACVNVANLLLARTAARRQEIAIRVTLGAGRSRLIRQFLTESLLLALAGGAAGLAIGVWGSRALVRLAAADLPRAHEITPDWRLFAFLFAVCVTTGIAFGLGPAMAATRVTGDALKSRSVASAVRDGLVVLEFALAFILLAGVGLLLRTFLNLERTSAGVNAEGVLTAHVIVSGGIEAMAVENRVAQIHGVRAAGLVSLLPLQYSEWSGGFRIKGRPGIFESDLRYVTPGYFRAIGIPLRRGREFSTRDSAAVARVILVNETLARQYFRNDDPVGRETDRGTIIGVVGDVRQAALSIPPKPEIYYTVGQNFAQMRMHGLTLVVRTTGSPEPLAGAIRAAVRDVSPGQALFRIATMQDVIDESLSKPWLYMWLVGLFTGIGTFLAMAGIFGVIAYVVTLRTREFGIRMALGADGGRVLRMVLVRGAVLISAGLVTGVAGAAVLTRVLRNLLYGIAATDPPTFTAMAVVLAAAGLAACWIPARRAAQMNPSVALRSE
jgi:predicted permease